MPVESQKALFLVVLIIIAVLASKKPGKKEEEKMQVDSPDAIVLVPPTGIGASLKVDRWAKENGLELRRYDVDVDLSNAEGWAKELYDLAKGHTPAAVVCIDESITVIEIDDQLCKHLERLK